MAKISRNQRRFLQSQSIPLSRVFDASGMTRSNYQAAMSKLDMIVAVGVTLCKKAGHTIRTRFGHCAQCNTQAPVFQLRYANLGEVYIAVSKRSGLVKIGTAEDSYARMKSLNSQGYGGTTDWKVYSHYICKKVGRIEFLAKKSLSQYHASETYVKSGNTIDCQELFVCSPFAAKEAVQIALKQVQPQI